MDARQSAPARARAGAPARSYLLRVRRTASGTVYLLQDLRSGERRQFATPAELQRHLDAGAAAGLR